MQHNAIAEAIIRNMTNTCPREQHAHENAISSVWHRSARAVRELAPVRWRSGLLVMLMLAGATTACSQNVQTQSQTMDPLTAGARLLHTQSATVGEPEQRIVRDQAQWAALWTSLHAGMPAPPLPPVDFSLEVVAFATMGTRPTGGFELDVAGTQKVGTGLDVVLVETVPAADCMLTQAETAPTVAVRVPRAAGTMRFTVQRKTARC